MSALDSTLISALRILARDVESDDGVANAMLFEAAERFGKLALEAHNLRAEVERMKQVQRWIPVEDRLPELGFDVLVLKRNGEHEVAWRDVSDGKWSSWSISKEYEYAYWMPLPEPPDHIGERNE